MLLALFREVRARRGGSRGPKALTSTLIFHLHIPRLSLEPREESPRPRASEKGLISIDFMSFSSGLAMFGIILVTLRCL